MRSSAQREKIPQKNGGHSEKVPARFCGFFASFLRREKGVQ